MIQQALEDILEMDVDDTQRYLLALLERDPELFNSIHEDILHMDILEEMREETHNGYPIYPELQL